MSVWDLQELSNFILGLGGNVSELILSVGEFQDTLTRSSIVVDFSAGPCVLPKAVLDKAAEEIHNYRGSGQSVLELAHRQDEFRYISTQTKDEIRKFLKVPNTHRILL
jgi:hypothetical protein